MPLMAVSTIAFSGRVFESVGSLEGIDGVASSFTTVFVLDFLNIVLGELSSTWKSMTTLRFQIDRQAQLY